MQKIEGGFVARYFHVGVRFRQREIIPVSRDMDYWKCELSRSFFISNENGDPISEDFEYRQYKQHGDTRWCPDGDVFNNCIAYLYTDNLPDVWNDTRYKYCSADIWQKKEGRKPVHLWKFMKEYLRYPMFEYLIKTGLTRILGDTFSSYYYYEGTINLDAKKPNEILGIGKYYTKMLMQINGGKKELRIMKQCESDNIQLKAEEIQRWCSMLGGDDETLGLINSHKEISATRFMNYIEKQAKIYQLKPEQMNSWNSDLHRSELRIKNLVRDWKDYISWCASLKVNLKDEYYLLPPHFQKAHDNMYIKERLRADAVALEKQKKMMKKVNEIMKNAISEGGYSFKTKKLMIVVPKDAADIKREGELQHHCVGGYVDKVARGETMILFVRRVSNPDKPYYTMEWKNNKIEQCQGEHRKDMTPNVEAFVKAFEQMKLREKLKELEGAVG